MILIVEGLEVRYGAVSAVKGISFSLQAGECVALLGANGAGKTSSVEAIAGLLPKSSGSVMFEGSNITTKSASTIACMGLSLVPQWRDLFANFTVAETLLAARVAAKGREPRSENYIFELFPRLAERSKSLAGNLSGGEQQMLAISRALIARPKVLILDEPSAGLASGVLDAVFEVINTIRLSGVSLVLVEQNLELAARIADRCLVLSVGRVTWSGSLQNAIHDETVRNAYFG
jgi:branched-chain amino acid transport system ATP-binding protein